MSMTLTILEALTTNKMENYYVFTHRRGQGFKR